MNQRAQVPIKEFRAGGIKAAIWREDGEDQGRTVVTHSVRIQKRYFDNTSSEWRTTEYFFSSDLPRLCLVAQKAFEYIALGESEDRSSQERSALSQPDEE